MKKLIIVGIIIFVAIAVVGGFFANKKSEPVYTTKIDKIMFDTKNKSPKYVITMPEKGQIETVKATADRPHETNEEPKEEKPFLQTVFDNIPSVAKLDALPETGPLKYVNSNIAMVEKEKSLTLPKISDSGKKPWVEYARASEVRPNFHKVAIVVKNVGLDKVSSEAIIKGMPPEVSFSFSPYAINSSDEIKLARTLGHETYVDLLLASKNFLHSDTGPKAMSLTASIDEVVANTKETISTNFPIGGVIINKGIADQDNREHLKKALEELKNRGLLVIDATNDIGIDEVVVEGLARQKADIVIDEQFSQSFVKKALEQAEEIARRDGFVTVVINPKPSVIMAVKDWIDTFSPQIDYLEAKEKGIDLNKIERPFALVPVSSMVVE